MKLILSIILAFVTLLSSAQISLDKLKKETEKIKNKGINGNTSKLSNDDIIKGLKEALEIGAGNGSALATKVDGYYKNPKITIPFPKDAQRVETALRSAGMGKLVDDFVLSVNRSAEQAAKEAKPIFVNAIKGVTISDGLAILQGGDNAATQYLQGKTSADLQRTFKPIVQQALQSTQATKYWGKIITTYNALPTTRSKINPDLPGYATDKAIAGLFVLIAEEELKIRKDPAARVTSILRKVFG